MEEKTLIQTESPLIRYNEDIKRRVNEGSLLSDTDLLKRLFWREVDRLIPVRWRYKTFDEFNFDIKNGHVLRAAVERVKKWDFEKPEIFGIISGFTGIGKSHMLFCLFKKYLWEFFEKHKNYNYEQYLSLEGRYLEPHVRIISEIDLLAEIKNIYEDYSQLSELEVMKPYYSYDFLCIDGMFDDKKNDFAMRVHYEILEKRYNWSCVPTAVTSNCSLGEINDIKPQIASRLNMPGGVNIETKIYDYREKEIKNG